MHWSCFPPGIQPLLVFYSIASLLLVGFAAVYLQTSAKLLGSSLCEIGNSLKVECMAYQLGTPENRH